MPGGEINENFEGIPGDVLEELESKKVSEGVIRRIAEAFQAKDKMGTEKQQQEFYNENSKMIDTANIIPFTQFVNLFSKALKDKGEILKIKKVPEQDNRQLIYFKLNGFNLEKPLLFDIYRAPDGYYSNIPYFNLPDNITSKEKYEICSLLNSILKSCLEENKGTEKSDLNPEEMSEKQLKQGIIKLLKEKKYVDLKNSLIGNEKFVGPESTMSDDCYDIRFGSLLLNVWDNLNSGLMYSIDINGNNRDELKELYVLLTK